MNATFVTHEILTWTLTEKIRIHVVACNILHLFYKI